MFIFSALAPNLDALLIGLHQDNDKWMWVDGSENSYRNWERGEPDGFGHCAVIVANGKWWAWDCRFTQPFVCELTSGF